MNSDLQEKLSNLPVNPGVYLFKDFNGQVIYVGKAKRLKNRVKSYFQDSRNHNGKTQIMVSKITELELLLTDSEAEALILESNLIKKLRPRYNISYRDDKSLPYICITSGDRPRIFPTRSTIRDGSKYFGPYDLAGRMRSMLEVIRKVFGLCSCACTSRNIDRSRGLPKWKSCFEEYVGQCSSNLPDEDYQEAIKRVMALLNGKTDKLIRELKEEMELYSGALQFEKAAFLRDGILALEKYSQKMKVVSGDQLDRDIFALEMDTMEGVACGILLRVRDGKLIGRHHKFLADIEFRSDGEMLQAFMEDYYTSEIATIIPDEVHISHELIDQEPLEQYLWQEHRKKVPFILPKIGDKAQMIRMAQTNARLLISEWVLQRNKAEIERIPHSVKALQKDLFLFQPPRRIECFDNSNFQGSDPVASMVVFVDSKPRKALYKRFMIKSVVGPDDFASMYEVVYRRYSRLKKEGGHLPDLIIVDGGKGQLSSAVEALKDAGLFGDIPVAGLAKRLEEVFITGKGESIQIPKTSSGLKLMQRIRDEAHRYAITYHREKRSKRTLSSELTSIPGIGQQTAEKLIRHFGSVKKIKASGMDELIEVVGNAVSQKIVTYFNDK